MLNCYYEQTVNDVVTHRICKRTKLYVSPSDCQRCKGETPVVTPVVTPVETPVVTPTVETSWVNISDKLEATLPPAKETDRPIRFNTDGSIEYLDSDNWEPPREIGDGWRRDPENNRRFIPIILPCADRNQKATRYAKLRLHFGHTDLSESSR